MFDSNKRRVRNIEGDSSIEMHCIRPDLSLEYSVYCRKDDLVDII